MPFEDIDIQFPINGRDDSVTPLRQSLTTTREGVNARATDPRTNRICGARRRGTSLFCSDRSGTHPIRDGVSVVYDPRVTSYQDLDDPTLLYTATIPDGGSCVDLRAAPSGDRMVLSSTGKVYVVNRQGTVVSTITPPYVDAGQVAEAIEIDEVGRLFIGTGSGDSQANAKIWLIELSEETDAYEVTWTYDASEYVKDLTYDEGTLVVLVSDAQAGRSYVLRLEGVDQAAPAEVQRCPVPAGARRLVVGPDGDVAVAAPRNTSRGLDARYPDAGQILDDELSSWELTDITEWSTVKYSEFDPSDLALSDGDDVAEWSARDGVARSLACPYGSVALHGIGLPLYPGATGPINGDALELSLPDRSIVETYAFKTSVTHTTPGEVDVSTRADGLKNLKELIENGGGGGSKGAKATEPSRLVTTNGDGAIASKLDLVCKTDYEVVLVSFIGQAGSTVSMGWGQVAVASATVTGQTESKKTVDVTAPKFKTSGMSGRPCVVLDGVSTKLETADNTSKRPTEISQHHSVFPGAGVSASRSGSVRFAAFFLVRPEQTYTASCLWGQSIDSGSSTWHRMLSMDTRKTGPYAYSRGYMAVAEQDYNGGSPTTRWFENQIDAAADPDLPPSVNGFRLVEVVSDPQGSGGTTEVWCNGFPMPRSSTAFSGCTWDEANMKLWGTGLVAALVASQTNYVVIASGTELTPGVYKVNSSGTAGVSGLDYLVLSSSPLASGAQNWFTCTVDAANDYLHHATALNVTAFDPGGTVRIRAAGTSGLIDDLSIDWYTVDTKVGTTDITVQGAITGAIPHINIAASVGVDVWYSDASGVVVSNTCASVANDSLNRTHIGQYSYRAPGSASNIPRSHDRFWKGEIYSIVTLAKFGASPITASDRQLVEGRMAWKFGAQSMLPANHPYRLYPPPPVGGSTDDYYRARAALSQHQLVALVDGSNFDVKWVRTSLLDNVAETFQVGGLGSGVAWTEAGGLVSCGMGAPNAVSDPDSVVRLDPDDGSTIWALSLGPDVHDTIDGEAQRVTIDAFGNALVPVSSTVWVTGARPLVVGVDNAGGELFRIDAGSDQATCAVVDAVSPKADGTTLTRDDHVAVGTSTAALTYGLVESTTPDSMRERDVLVVCGNDIVRLATGPDTATVVGSNAIVTSPYVQSAVLYSKVFWTDGIGPYRMYDPRTGLVSEYKSTSRGAFEPRCSLIEAYRGAIWLGRAPSNPHNWFLTKRGDPFNADYRPMTPTSVQAVAGNNSLAGLVDDIVNGFAAWNDDLAVMFGDHSIWRMTGDPAANGQIDLITRSVGGAFGRAYAFGPGGELYFWGAQGGLYAMAPGGMPQLLSQRVHRTFAAVDLSQYFIRMAWDLDQDGLLIFVCPFGGSGAAVRSFFWERSVDAFWEDEYSNPDHQVTSAFIVDGDGPDDRFVVMGCADGYTRKVDRTALDDSGSPIFSSVTIGPISARSGRVETKFSRLQVMLDHAGGEAFVAVYASDSPTDVGVRKHIYTARPGLGQTFSARAVGGYLWLKIHGSQPWVWQTATAIVQPGGFRRLRG